MDIATLAASALKGALGGAVYGYSAYKKNHAQNVKYTFDAKKFVPTLLVSAMAGVLVEFVGGDVGLVSTALESAGVTVIVQKLYGAIVK